MLEESIHNIPFLYPNDATVKCLTFSVEALEHEGKIILEAYTQEKFYFYFKNGYGASVIRGPLTYGGDEGLWEMGIMNGDGNLTYDTPITNDVLGYLTEVDVSHNLGLVNELS